MRTAGIYLIIHTRTGKVYVGQSKNISRRWQNHKQDLDLNKHHNHKLQKLWLDEGENAFNFQALHFLPDGLSALESQRWLVNKETEVWWEYRQQNLTLNLVRPEIVETKAAIDEYNLERKSKTIIITNEIKSLKPKLQTLRDAVSAKSREIDLLCRQRLDVEALFNRNSGWRSFIFGKTTNLPIEHIKQELENKRAKIALAEAEKKYLDAELQNLEQKNKKLHRTYPGNIDRRIAKNAMFTGSINRKPTIR